MTTVLRAWEQEKRKGPSAGKPQLGQGRREARARTWKVIRLARPVLGRALGNLLCPGHLCASGTMACQGYQEPLAQVEKAGPDMQPAALLLP